MLLAQGLTEIELLKSLAQNWPFLAVLAGGMWWFATQIAKPLTVRHITWMDEQEKREKERSLADQQHQHTLEQVHEKVSTLNDKASQIKDMVSRGVPPMQPHGG